MTPRQYQVALLVAQGFSNKQIAHRLGMSIGTVKMHLHNIYALTKFTNRTELALAVIEAEEAAQS